MRSHIFVDETKSRGFIMAAVSIPESDVAAVRQEVKRFILPGQRRIHFHKERNERRTRFLGMAGSSGARVTLYDATRIRDLKIARDTCLAALVSDLAKAGAVRLILERDDSVVKADREVLYQAVRAEGLAARLRYDLLYGHEEPLLAVPDAVAWAWTRDRYWKAKVRHMVIEERVV